MATVSATLRARPVTLEQLSALSDEIGALARAGVPLDRGLRELSRDMPGRLGRLAGEMSRRLEAGGAPGQGPGGLGLAVPAGPSRRGRAGGRRRGAAGGR